MEFRLLGTIELWADGQRVHLGALQERCALASLALDIGTPVSQRKLIDRLWEDGATSIGNARSNLYPLISRIRRILAEHARPDDAQPPFIETRTRTYTLHADRQTVDVHRYASLISQARSLSDSGDDHHVLRLLDTATPLWRGEPLAGLHGAWVEEVRATLTEHRVDAALLRSTTYLRTGRYTESVGLLTPLRARHPSDETIAQHLMIALYGSGRTTDALNVYPELRRLLVDSVGSEPSPEVARLHHGILLHTPVSTLTATVAGTVHHLPVGSLTNLPRDTHVVGRRKEMRLLRSALAEARQTTQGVVALEAINGMGGVGKTTLAVHAAHELSDIFPDGTFYVNLRAHDATQAPLSAEAALDTLLRTLGIAGEQIPHTLEEATAMWRTLLAHRRAVVVLDDAASPEQVYPLLPGSSSTLIIITSRYRLTSLPYTHHVSLDTLSQEEAVALFRERVTDQRPLPTADVHEIVRICGHLPLAIEMTASRLASRSAWSTADLIQRLSRTDRLLYEIRDTHRPIAMTFELSYRGLTRNQRIGFRRIGLHTGANFGPHAAAALTGFSLLEVEDLLEDLLNAHLIQEPKAHRYRIHDLLWQYAKYMANREEDVVERGRCVDRLIDFYLHSADRADRLLYPRRARLPVHVTQVPEDPLEWPDQAAAHAWFVTEHSNLLASAELALTRGSPRRSALFAHTLAGFLEAESFVSTAEDLHSRAVTYWREVDHPLAEGWALLDLSAAHDHAGQYHKAIAAAERALGLARSLEHIELAAESLHRLAIPYAHLGEPNKALLRQREALELRMRIADRHQQARAQNNLAISLRQLGQYAEALPLFLIALDGFQESQDKRREAHLHNNLGDVRRDLGFIEESKRSYEQALRLAQLAGTPWDRASIQSNLAGALLESGDLEQALALYREALPLFRRIGEKRKTAVVLNGIGTTFRSLGRHDEAAAHHSRAIELAQDIAAAPEHGEGLRGLALAERELGQLTDALRHAQAALDIARHSQSPVAIRESEETLAAVRDE